MWVRRLQPIAVMYIFSLFKVLDAHVFFLFYDPTQTRVVLRLQNRGSFLSLKD